MKILAIGEQNTGRLQKYKPTRIKKKEIMRYIKRSGDFEHYRCSSYCLVLEITALQMGSSS